MTELAEALYLFVFTHPVPVLIVLVPLAALALSRPPLNRHAALRVVAGQLALSGGLLAVIMAAAAAIDLTAPGFLNPTSSGLASTAAHFAHGAVLYTPADDPRIYSYIYGPVMFVAHLPALWLVDGVALVVAIKLTFAALFLAGCAVFARTLLRRFGTLPALGLLLVYVLLLARYGETPYSNRGDCILLALVCFAVPLVRLGRRPGLLAGLAMGLLAGLAAGTKLHALVYFLPFALWGMRAGGWRWTAAAVVGGLCALGLPFLDPRIAAADYADWVSLSFAQGLDGPTLLHAAQTGLLYLAPPLAVLIFGWRHLGAEARLLLGTTALMLVLVLVPAGKIGAGAHHFIPAFPVLVLALASGLREAGLALVMRLRGAWSVGAISAWLAVLFVLGLGPSVLVAVRMAGGYGDPTPAAVSEAASRFAGRNWQIGFGEGFAMSDAYAVVPGDAGQPLFVDYHAAADRFAAGRPVGGETVAALASCPHEFWLLPAGQVPFAGGSIMTRGKPAFGQAFRAAFGKHYGRIESGPVFDVWACRETKPQPDR